jgi:hypothetical protein
MTILRGEASELDDKRKKMFESRGFLPLTLTALNKLIGAK